MAWEKVAEKWWLDFKAWFLAFKPWFSIWLVWRLGLFLVVILGSNFLNYRTNNAFTQVGFYQPQQIGSQISWLANWANFDGVHYLNLALRGYVDEARFLPFLPLLLAGFKFFLPNQFLLLVSLVFSQILSLLSLVSLYHLLKLDYEESMVQHTLWLLLCFPTSFFLGSLYTESLFLLLLTLALFLARKKRWFWAGLAAMSLAITRVVGVVLVLVLLVEWWCQQNWGLTKTNFLKALRQLWPILLAPLSLASYAYYNFKRWNQTFYFLKTHTLLGNSRSFFTNPLKTFYYYGRIVLEFNFTQHEWRLAVFELVITFFCLTLLVLAWRQKLNVTYQFLAWLLFLIPFISGTFSGLPRYALVVFPFFLSLANLKKRWRWLYILLSVPLLITCTLLFSRGYFIA